MGGNYRKKDIIDWGWQEFQNYFDDKYSVELEKKPPKYKMGARKQQIESSLSLRGANLLKEMIDWAFYNRRNYNWTDFNIHLCLGQHWWAETIAEKAEEELSSKLNRFVEDL